MVLNFVRLPYIHSIIGYNMLREEHDELIEMRRTKMITFYVRRAIERTKELEPVHWNRTLNDRSQNNSLGSSYKMTSEDLEDTLLNSCNFGLLQHDEIQSNCEGFITHDLLGYTGLVELKQFPPNFLVKLENNKGNFLSCVAQIDNLNNLDLAPKEPTVLIIGKSKGEDVVYTFHAGEPVTPSRITGEEKTITAKEAISMGFDYAKVRLKEEEE